MAAANENYYNAETGAQAAAEAPDEAAAGEEYAGDEEQLPEIETPQPAKSFTVTSIQKCYERLGREETLDIQKNFIKPYQECQRRLALKLKKEREEKAAKANDKPEKRRGYHRVRNKNDSQKPSEKADLKGKSTP